MVRGVSDDLEERDRRSYAQLREIINDIVKPIRDSIGELVHDLDRHMHEEHAHAEAGLDDKRKLSTLWDERNELKGEVRSQVEDARRGRWRLGVLISLVGILVALAVVVIQHFWK
jgi:replication fork clamp-binding protein CrfC